MALDMFLDIDGVKGESQVKGYEKTIDIFGHSWSASNPSSVGTGSGSGAGKVSMTSLSVQKMVDSASPDLFKACTSGKHFSKAKLSVCKAGGESPVVYLTYDFTQVFVDSISWGGSSGGGKVSESVSFSFATIKVSYTEQSATGTGSTKVPTGWDIQKNTKL